MDQERLTAVAELWKAHRKAAFRGRLRGIGIAGIDMVMLDSDVAGCISTWLDNRGAIEDRRWDVLATRESQLEHVMPDLFGCEVSYCKRLLDMTAFVLDAPSDSPSD